MLNSHEILNSYRHYTNQITYSNEILRKLIHISSLWMCLLVYFFDKAWIVLGSLLLGILLVENLRRSTSWFSRLFETVFGQILRKHEHSKLMGASFVLLAAFLCSVFFPTIVAVTSLSIMLVGDSSAALIGRRFGRHPLLDKSYEGSIAFLVSSFLVVGIIGTIVHAGFNFYFAGLIACVVGTVAELVSSRIRIDDNLSIALSCGFIMWLIMGLLA